MKIYRYIPIGIIKRNKQRVTLGTLESNGDKAEKKPDRAQRHF